MKTEVLLFLPYLYVIVFHAVAFFFKEKTTLPHIRRDMVDFYHIPQYALNSIKEGTDWITDDGDIVKYERLTTPADPVRSYVYCSDTMYLPELHKMVCGVSTLYHESTYASDNEFRAKKYFHSTSGQDATVAKDAKANKLLLGHYSARYENEQLLLKEAMEIFPNTFLSDENKIFDV